MKELTQPQIAQRIGLLKYAKESRTPVNFYTFNTQNEIFLAHRILAVEKFPNGWVVSFRTKTGKFLRLKIANILITELGSVNRLDLTKKGRKKLQELNKAA